MFMSVAIMKPLPTAVLTLQILLRQNAVKNLSSYTTTTITYNN